MVSVVRNGRGFRDQWPWSVSSVEQPLFLKRVRLTWDKKWVCPPTLDQSVADRWSRILYWNKILHVHWGPVRHSHPHLFLHHWLPEQLHLILLQVLLTWVDWWVALWSFLWVSRFMMPLPLYQLQDPPVDCCPILVSFICISSSILIASLPVSSWGRYPVVVGSWFQVKGKNRNMLLASFGCHKWLLQVWLVMARESCLCPPNLLIKHARERERERDLCWKSSPKYLSYGSQNQKCMLNYSLWRKGIASAFGREETCKNLSNGDRLITYPLCGPRNNKRKISWTWSSDQTGVDMMWWGWRICCDITKQISLTGLSKSKKSLWNLDKLDIWIVCVHWKTRTRFMVRLRVGMRTRTKKHFCSPVNASFQAKEAMSNTDLTLSILTRLTRKLTNRLGQPTLSTQTPATLMTVEDIAFNFEAYYVAIFIYTY